MAEILSAGILLFAAGCSSAAVNEPAPESLVTSLRVDVLAESGAPVPGAAVVVRVYSRTVPETILSTTYGMTGDAGSFLYPERTALEGVFPVRITISPPSGSGLLGTEVSDSTEWVYGTPITKVVTVKLALSP